jgi:signal transduction histidine kinase
VGILHRRSSRDLGASRASPVAMAMRAIGFVSISGSFLLVGTLQFAIRSAELWPALCAMIPIAIFMIDFGRARTGRRATVYLAINGGCVFVVTSVLISHIPLASTSGSYPLMLLKLALLMTSGTARVGRALHSWCVAGFVVAECAVGAATLVAGGTIEPDLTVIGAVAGVVSLQVASLGGEAHATRSQRLEAQAVQDEKRAQERARSETLASALLHDTVLNDLSAVAGSGVRPLDAQLRNELRRDLSLVTSGEWRLGGSVSSREPHLSDGQFVELGAAVATANKLGVQVEVSGDPSALGLLSPARTNALEGAVHQCLVNIARHSGTDRADILVSYSSGDVCVMVVDAGVGFRVDSVAWDRLGLRQSVIHRIEDVGGSVRLWSAPKRGTSVILRVPSE